MSNDRTGADRDPAPALTRGVYILRILAQAQGEPVALADLARTLEAAKSSTSYLCTVLEEANLIRRVGNGYVLGHGTVELGGAYLRSFNEVREFYRFCNEAPTLSEQVVQMAMLQGSDVIYLARHEGRSPLRLTANLGDRFPAASTAVGNALLAVLPDDDIADRFRYPHAFPMRTSESVRNLSELTARLEQVRERGYAIDEGGVHPGISGVAVRMPPRSSSSPAIAIGCSFLTSATSPLQREAIVAELRELERLLENPMQPRENT
ncbi:MULTISPECIES: IclR family transcriptional regulator [Microbacterium]|jgi:IclR family transcriptional regulator, blcABC operon repressor|uniref:IclR family transcriptional regulator n=1 Tax=Microbacterium TaxID=33882 RepID=UPI0023D9F884|nr:MULTISPECIES: IclR family transcriptional regulator [Microbacterium]MDF2045347.1 IclR family transcriptional regulator [Microbacterium sp. Kw_RZR3]MDQ1074763.1 DNA-binding IclR family transcriptional regulator [Microbacterium sp. SORGH_AS_0969]MDQ1114989.1 DNA-binding IclR family transcriptional regulator [Microbacterium testaceum]